MTTAGWEGRMHSTGHSKGDDDFHAWCFLTSFVQPSVHDAVLDFHVPGEVPLQRELARAVEAFEGLAVRVEMHVAHQVVHPVELLAAELKSNGQRHSD